MPVCSRVFAAAAVIEGFGVAAMAFILLTPAPLEWLFLMLLPVMSSCIIRFRYGKDQRWLDVFLLFLHFVEAATVVMFARYHTSELTVATGTVGLVLLCAGSLLEVCLLMSDMALFGLAAVICASEDAKKRLAQLPLPEIHRSELADGSKEETCVICLQELEVGEEVAQLQCCHLFHSKCLDMWVRSHKRAPWCPLRCDDESACAKKGQPEEVSPSQELPV
eukprot:CAMPEP_0178431806 /NCGR_PEP_ID=MMETSP0689_2-20121128/32052_1 /TAXON_ID=160604 /ORGANISM="Amphidinium massartii, Strain CS-259" /LENGTH=220 /DNA_ID=CAMNT_0020053759 /DNA_START=32 /DNA_END=694 /DNA_ORIENTATION=-